MAKTVLITGGCGFIGSHLVDHLVGRGYGVRVLDNLAPQVHPTGQPDYLNPSVEYLFDSILDPDALSRSLDGVDLVVHFAAAVGVGQSMYEPEHYVRTNSLGTAALLQKVVSSSSRPAKLLVASSMSVYGEGSADCPYCGPKSAARSTSRLEQGIWDARCPECEEPLQPSPTHESKALEPTSIYALTKLDQEIACLSIGRAYEMPIVALRFFNVYGPRQSLSNPYTGVAAIFSSRLRSNQSPILYEDGNQMRDFVHINDIVAACTLALEADDADFRVFNVGSGEPISIDRLARLLIKIHGLEGEFEPCLSGSYRAGDIRHCFGDIEAIRQLGYRPQVSLEVGLRELATWSASARSEDRFEEAQRELRSRGLG
jgi:dTDP-L-rhamnose 4-epimerase